MSQKPYNIVTMTAKHFFFCILLLCLALDSKCCLKKSSRGKNGKILQYPTMGVLIEYKVSKWRFGHRAKQEQNCQNCNIELCKITFEWNHNKLKTGKKTTNHHQQKNLISSLLVLNQLEKPRKQSKMGKTVLVYFSYLRVSTTNTTM